MEGFKNLVVILLSSVLVNNYVLSRFLGICPFLGVSKKTKTAAKYDDHEPQHDKMNTKNHVIVLSYNNNFTHKYA